MALSMIGAVNSTFKERQLMIEIILRVDGDGGGDINWPEGGDGEN